ncbi:cobalamin biosynthesis protein [Natrarchaeobius oligotrophus]|uniref:Cobalamin biosynthesis protein n=1 Tax=Natrarchaeobius chitinivorans TaxID=1679083 RepID=A0A3N6PQZ7_NATCH|nr:cobalamin biosynthesis protein [Natrarchaeobius chitinivorans]RQH01796.1 cobalamin biosynthesis protein [Natrarchaeobius chitinivorans]
MTERTSETSVASGGERELEVPADPVAAHPASAYFWGHVAGSGTVADDGIEVVTADERSATVLAAIAGGEIEHEASSRPYVHDTSITRTEDEYALTIDADEGGLLGRTTALGLPVDGRGNYRFTAFAEHERELLRGLFEGCGTICYKSSSETVGISFVHEDEALLSTVLDLLADAPVEAPTGSLSETASGGYWFGVDDDAAPDVGSWLYETCEETGLYAPSRRRKLERSLERADDAD